MSRKSHRKPQSKKLSGAEFFPLLFQAALLFFLFCAVSTQNAFAFDLAPIRAEELAATRAKWVILDARPGADWLSGHIPGALSFSWKDHTFTDNKGRAYRLPPPSQLAATLGRMGIDENTPVVLYGDAERSMGGEGWITWVLLWLGHRGPIRELDGGIQAWKDHGYSLAAGPERPARSPAVYRVRLRPEILVKTGALESKTEPFALIDTRSELEWLFGRIPGAIHISWTDFRAGPQRRPLERAALEKLFKSHGVAPDKPVIFYCTGGVRSGYAWMVYELDGLSLAANYTGGWDSWKFRIVLPPK
jgi:thiosulfate/3-mercaptopyruvate sulfurtransferase